MKINWKVRVKNRLFWVALIPAVLVLVKTILALFGIEIDVEGIEAQLIAIVEAAFVILSIFGIVIDPTTAHIGDSEQALTYEEPKE